MKYDEDEDIITIEDMEIAVFCLTTLLVCGVGTWLVYVLGGQP